MNDTPSFGSFTHAFLTRFRDDFVKLPCLSFPVLSGCTPGKVDADDARGIKKALNDALLLQGLSELSTITVPIQPPSVWSSSSWSNNLHLNVRALLCISMTDIDMLPQTSSIYQTSAILATHIEDVTLPLRCVVLRTPSVR